MTKLTTAVIALFFIIYCIQYMKCSDTLRLVHVIFRHGDRTPDKKNVYPTDPYINHTYNVGWGQLTNEGKRKEYLLGKILRKRYGKFLGQFNIDIVDARSTDYNRTKMSLQLVLASLFPPKDDLIWEKNLKWQPVPFNYWDVQNDHVLGNTQDNCPKYKKIKNEFIKNYKFDDVDLKTMDHLIKHAGIDKSYTQASEVYFTTTIEAEHGFTLPNWTEGYHPHLIKRMAILEYNISTALPQLKRLSSGFLLKKIINDSLDKKKNPLEQKTKMFLYSAHECNIAFLLRLLNSNTHYYDHVPPYGSCLIFEIHNINGIWAIRVYYEAYDDKNPIRLKIPFCGNLCKLDKFINIYKQYLPISEKECF